MMSQNVKTSLYPPMLFFFSRYLRKIISTSNFQNLTFLEILLRLIEMKIWCDVGVLVGHVVQHVRCRMKLIDEGKMGGAF